MHLFELFDQIEKYQYTNTNGTVNAYFIVGNMKYRVIETMVNGRLLISFTAKEVDVDDYYYDTAVTGTGNEFKVFSTILDITKRAISELKPNQIYFTADLSEPSRVKLYNRLATKMATQYGYTIQSNKNTNNEHTYLLTKTS
ncbi:hypothetical protein RVBP17_2590 [Pseudomonas phage sp. 30-3]|nr:hypothetical protein Paride_0150 [Pseudomonas phage Paride]BDR26216.1 hypothetical protein RVBP17_2590 [Pseudomonas phage sp. 30-3]